MFDRLKLMFGRGPTMADLLKREIAESEMNLYRAQREIEYQEATKALALVQIQRATTALAKLTPATRDTKANATLQPPRHP